jgi:hypothetical protein
MMIRKMVAASALLFTFTTGTAAAQDSPGPSVAPTVVEKAPPATVQGNTVLPRTGGDLDAEVLAGAALTAAGLAFAVTARQRRRRVESSIA